MKNYAETYVSLREEIMQAIDEKLDNLCAKYDVECLNELENHPIMQGDIIEYIDCDDCSSDRILTNMTVTNLYIGGIVTAHNYYGDEAYEDEYGLYEFTTDSLIEIYETLCKYE